MSSGSQPELVVVQNVFRCTLAEFGGNSEEGPFDAQFWRVATIERSARQA